LTTALNKIHSVNFSKKYWRILIGPWLYMFVEIVFDRWSMLGKAVKDYNIGKYIAVNKGTNDFIPNNTSHFVEILDGDDWNESIFTQIVKSSFRDKINIKEIKLSAKKNYESQPSANKKNSIKFTGNFKVALASKICQYASKFSKQDKYFFYSTCLPLKIDIKIQLRLGQFPKLWRSIRNIEVNNNQEYRKWSLDFKSNNDLFLSTICDLIPKNIPTNFLEGYEDMQRQVDSLKWPQKPKYIFTCNAYQQDDFFKMYTAQQSDKGCKLVIAQHGGNMGMSLWASHEDHQMDIASRFLSWGWKKAGRKNIFPVGNIKLSRKQREFKDNTQGKVLLIGMGVPRYSYHLYAVPIAAQWLEYFKDQVEFYGSLPNLIKSEVSVRLYPHDYKWCQKNRWRDKFSSIKFSDLSQDFYTEVEKSKVVVCTYNATTYLETLALNIPTIVFFDTHYWEVHDDVKPYFEILKSVGVFHENPSSAAKQLELIWDNVDTWWLSNDVQSAIECFCRNFSSPISDPVSKFQAAFDFEKNTKKH
jgi:putative transferase (TIGR04331 family)